MGKHTEWRKLAKKLRRKRIRQKLAKQRKQKEEQERLEREKSPSYQAKLEEQRIAEEFQQQEEVRLSAEREAEWRRVEKEAQKQWRLLQEKLQVIRAEREKQNQKIRDEWEREQKRLEELKLEKEQEVEEARKRQERVQQQINDYVERGGEIPEKLTAFDETNPSKPLCPFFEKTGACRFRDACSRNHKRPRASRVVLIPNFYSHYSLEQIANEHGSDSSLEFDNRETYEHFREFFFDVLPELEGYGKIRQFRVCCNREAHLRGNVYVEYSSRREAIKCFKALQGRWYGGKQLNVEFCHIESWNSAICGLHFRRKCPKGSSCNFLHVFKNPGGLFGRIEKDVYRTPLRSDAADNFTPDTRNCRWSESPERIEERVDNEHSNNGRSKHRHSKRKRSRSRSSSSKRRARGTPQSSHRKRSRSRSSSKRRARGTPPSSHRKRSPHS